MADSQQTIGGRPLSLVYQVLQQKLQVSVQDLYSKGEEQTGIPDKVLNEFIRQTKNPNFMLEVFDLTKTLQSGDLIPKTAELLSKYNMTLTGKGLESICDKMFFLAMCMSMLSNPNAKVDENFTITMGIPGEEE